jgi:hypothetical protein
MKSLFRPLILVALAAFSFASCEKDPSLPREVYAVMETKTAGPAQSFFFLNIYDQNLAILGGVGITGDESPLKKSGQTFNVMKGTNLKINGLLNNPGNVFWSDVTVKVYIDGRVKWSKRFKEGDSYTSVYETVVVE